ncbi:MAG: extracellular solute-binding protein [Planctomycetales bacterium]
MHSITRSLTILSLSLILLSLAGCPNGNPKSGDNSVANNREIAIAVPKGRGFPTAWEGNLGEWSARTGGKPTLKEVENSSAEKWDLGVMPLGSYPELVLEGKIAPIPKVSLGENQLDWGRIFQGLREKGGETSSGPTVLPISAPVLVLYYRADLLEAAKLSPPVTWEDYGKLLADLPKWAPGLKAVEPWGPEFRGTMFLARAACYGKHPDHSTFLIDSETGDPLIGSPAFQRAWKIAQEQIGKLSPDVMKMTPADCRKAILAGEAALAITQEFPNSAVETDSAQPNTPVKRDEKAKLGFIRLPGTKDVYNPTLRAWENSKEQQGHRVTLIGYSGLCAAVAQKTEEAARPIAWSLITTLVLEENAQMPEGTLSLTRETDLGRGDQLTGPELNPQERGSYLDAVARSLRDRQLTMQLPVPHRGKFMASLNQHLTTALTDLKIPPEELVKRVEADWKKLIVEIGPTQVRDCCRISLGLRPLGDRKLATE